MIERVLKYSPSCGVDNSLILLCSVLRPYKYAGYPMLIKTIQFETGDDDLFSKSAPILTAASEVGGVNKPCDSMLLMYVLLLTPNLPSFLTPLPCPSSFASFSLSFHPSLPLPPPPLPLSPYPLSPPYAPSLLPSLPL